MAATGYTPIQLYYSTTSGHVPLASNLLPGELALNIPDGILFYNNAGTVMPFSSGSSGVTSFSGSTTGLTPATATTGAITLGGTLAVANGGTGVASSTGNTAVVLSVTPTITALYEVQTAISASNIDLTAGNYFSKTIAANTTFTVSNVPATATATSFILDLTNGGSATITWWSGVTWAGGTAPTLTAAGRDVLGFFTYNNGTTWTGLVLGLNLS
jgi:hypothetical protein